MRAISAWVSIVHWPIIQAMTRHPGPVSLLCCVFFTQLTSSSPSLSELSIDSGESSHMLLSQHIPVSLHFNRDSVLNSSDSEYEINITSPHCCIILIQFWWKFAVTGNISPSPQKTLFHPYPAFSQYLLTNHLFPHIQTAKSQNKKQIMNKYIQSVNINQWASSSGYIFQQKCEICFSFILLLDGGETNFIRWWVRVQSR